MNKDFNDDMRPLVFIIKGIFHDSDDNENTAFNYFANGFFNQTNTTKFNDIDWQRVIHNNYNKLSSSIHRFSDKNYFTTLNNTEIIESAWIQWATLIERHINGATVKDIKIVLAAMKCYIIASEITSNKKNDILIAKVCANCKTMVNVNLMCFFFFVFYFRFYGS